MMNTNQGLDICESVLTRLNAALDLAASEVACSNTAERRISGMVSRLLNERSRDSATKVLAFRWDCSGAGLRERSKGRINLASSTYGISADSRVTHRTIQRPTDNRSTAIFCCQVETLSLA